MKIGKIGKFNFMLALMLLIPILTVVTGQTSKASESDDSGKSLYISQDGDDNNDGTKDAPLETLKGARDTIRSLKEDNGLPAGGVTVYVRGGEYQSDSFQLKEEDSGTSDAPIEYQSYEDEDVKIVGGANLDPDSFEEVTDEEILDRLPKESREEVMQVDLDELGVKNYDDEIIQTGYGLPPAPSEPELYFNDEKMTLARYPNDGEVEIGEVDDPGAFPRDEEEHWEERPLPPIFDDAPTFEYTDDRPSEWENTGDIWMQGFWYHDWADGNLNIKDIDTENNRITTTTTSQYSVASGKKYYYYNVLEELDIPQEFYLDRDTGILYFYSPSDLEGSDIEVTTQTDPLISMDNVSNINIKGFTFELSRGDGIEMKESENNIVEDNKFNKLGDTAVTVKDGKNDGVVNNEIQDIGADGIVLEGGDRESLTPGNNFAENNVIHDFALTEETYHPGVKLSGVGNHAAHNEIYNAPHIAIEYTGNNHVIEYNEIYDAVKKTGDAGAIYNGRNWSEQGTMIRYNYIHDIGGYEGDYSQFGIYMDDLLSGNTAYGNVIENVPTGIFTVGGRSVNLENNIFLDNDKAINFEDGRDLGQEEYTGEGERMQKSLKEMPYQNELWSERYPRLSNILDDQHNAPKYGSVQKNVTNNSSDEMYIADAVNEYGIVQNNWETHDNLGFKDDSYELREDSPVFDEISGFEQIPFDKIGVQEEMNEDLLSDVTLHSPKTSLQVENQTKLWTMGNSTTGKYIDLFEKAEFSSEDSDIVDVDANGIITAKSPGETEIKVIAEVDGVEESDTIKIKVSQQSAEGMKTLLENITNNNFDNKDLKSNLKSHLDGVRHYEDKGDSEKVLKHMQGFTRLIDSNKDSMSEEAYQALKNGSDSMINKLE